MLEKVTSLEYWLILATRMAADRLSRQVACACFFPVLRPPREFRLSR